MQGMGQIASKGPRCFSRDGLATGVGVGDLDGGPDEDARESRRPAAKALASVVIGCAILALTKGQVIL
mgnify:CR=1 FL=1